MNIHFLPFGIIVLKLTETICFNINMLPKESAFVKYSNLSYVQEIIYNQPLETKIKFSASFANLLVTKELQNSKYKSSVFTDNEILSTRSNLNKESFSINSICKFDHDKLAAFALDKVCCEMSLRNGSDFEKVFDRKFCKLEITHTSSACYNQLEVLKKKFNFYKAEDFELKIYSRVFSSQDSKCSINSIPVDNLAYGYPQKLIVTEGLRVKWEVTDFSQSFGELEVGVPVDSIDINSETIFPVKIRSPKPFSNVIMTCSVGQDLSFSSISFESTKYEGDFSKSPENIIKIVLFPKENIPDIGDPMGEQLVNLRVRLLNSRMDNGRKEKRFVSWISCRVEKAFFAKNKKNIVRSADAKEKKIFIKVNEDNFIIIPIMEKKVMLSILNPVWGPIELSEKNFQIFNVHNTNDGSFIDITTKTKFDPISNSSLIFPMIDMKYSGEKNLIKYPDWKVILTMMGWQKMVTMPISLWQGEDWRLVTSDKRLNKILNWNYLSANSKQSCKPVYQTSRSQLLGRLVKESINGKKVYFGQTNTDQHPLLDMTTHLTMDNLFLSNKNVDISLIYNAILILGKQVGSTDLSVINNRNDKIAFDLIQIEEDPVSVTDIDVTCVNNLHITQPSCSFDVTFCSVLVHNHLSENPKQNCYLKLMLKFSDGTKVDLMDYKFTNFQLEMEHKESTQAIQNLDMFIYEPLKYKEPGKFTLYLSESLQCSKNKVIIKKRVSLYGTESTTEQTTTKSAPKTGMNTHIKLDTKVKSTSITTRPFNTTVQMTSTRGIDSETLFLSMKILIGLVLLVMLIIILNVIIKFRNRKNTCLLTRQSSNSQIYGQVDKLTRVTNSPLDATNPNTNNQLPPLLPPPGPLYNTSDSSQLDLAVNTTPDIFWSFKHSDDKANRKLNNENIIMGLPMHGLNGNDKNVSFPYMFPSGRKITPSPNNSDNVEYSFGRTNGSKHSQNRQNQPGENRYNYPPTSLHDNDSVASGSGSKGSSQIAVVVPPCPPLRWNKNWTSTQFPLYFSNDKDSNIDPSLCQFSNDNDSRNSSAPSNNSSWESKQPLILQQMGSSSIDNICEKSSGLGSLTSTQPGSDCSKKECTRTNSSKCVN